MEILDEIRDKMESCESQEEKIDLLNSIRELLSDLSPFDEPVDFVRWVKKERIEGNEYNPNEVAKPEMDLLYKSIKKDGYTQPIVAYEVDDDKYEVVDGFHRNLVLKENEDLQERTNDHLPITIIDKEKSDRMTSTIRHNRARGTHQIRDMSNLVVELFSKGWSDEEISEELGMEMDEVLRLKQVSGLKKAFSDHEFSQSWKEYKKKYSENHKK